MVALLAVLGGEHVVAATGGDDSGHRLAHAAADVADQAAVLDPGTTTPHRGGERVAERQVAEVADVERLGRVGAPEVDGVALAGGEFGVRIRDRPGLQRLAARLDPVVGEADVDAKLVLVHRGDRRIGGDLAEGLASRRIGEPVVDPGHQHQVALDLRPERRAGSPRSRAAVPRDGAVDAVEKIRCHNPSPWTLPVYGMHQPGLEPGSPAYKSGPLTD